MTRSHKRDVGKDALRQDWPRQAADLGFSAENLVDCDRARQAAALERRTQDHGDLSSYRDHVAYREYVAAGNAAWAAEHLGERQAVFSHSGFLAATLGRAPGAVSVEEAEQAVHGMQQRGDRAEIANADAKDAYMAALEADTAADAQQAQAVAEMANAVATENHTGMTGAGMAYKRAKDAAANMEMYANTHVLGLIVEANAQKAEALSGPARCAFVVRSYHLAFSPHRSGSPTVSWWSLHSAAVDEIVLVAWIVL